MHRANSIRNHRTVFGKQNEATATQHYSVPTCPCSGTTTMFRVKSKPCEIFGQVGLPPLSHADKVPCPRACCVMLAMRLFVPF